MKKILTIQDISCVGKCSVTAALPIISALGIETCIVPTALLSTHTQFDGFTFRDLSDEMSKILEHWKTQNFHFDAIYTGYLGSESLINLAMEFISAFKEENTKIIVDPAMADAGQLYAGLPAGLEAKMKMLCGCADIILPNISEACLMLDEPYPGEDASKEEIEALLNKLSTLGAKSSVITGVDFGDGTLGFAGRAEDGSFFSYGAEKINMSSHGTGDVFAATFTGSLVRGASEFEALKIATDFTSACIKNSYNDPDHVSYAVNFEAEIPYLLKRAGII